MRPVRTLLEQDSATAAAAAAAAAVQEAEQAAAAAAAADSSEPAAPSSASQDGEAGGPGSVASGGSEPAPALLAAEPEVEPQPRGGALVPRLDSLLRQAEKIAHAPHHAKVSLRPISMQARRGARIEGTHAWERCHSERALGQGARRHGLLSGSLRRLSTPNPKSRTLRRRCTRSARAWTPRAPRCRS